MAKDREPKIQDLLGQIDYMRDYITNLLKDQAIDHEEIKYLSAFISYKSWKRNTIISVRMHMRYMRRTFRFRLLHCN